MEVQKKVELHLPPEPLEERRWWLRDLCVYFHFDGGGGLDSGSERDLMNASGGPQRRQRVPLLSSPATSSSSVLPLPVGLAER